MSLDLLCTYSAFQAVDMTVVAANDPSSNATKMNLFISMRSRLLRLFRPTMAIRKSPFRFPYDIIRGWSRKFGRQKSKNVNPLRPLAQRNFALFSENSVRKCQFSEAIVEKTPFGNGARVSSIPRLSIPAFQIEHCQVTTFAGKARKLIETSFSNHTVWSSL